MNNIQKAAQACGYSQKTLASGLTVLVRPMPGYSTVHAEFATRFGSVYDKFVLNGKTVELPGVQFDTVENEDGTTGMMLGFVVYGLEKTPMNVLSEAGNGVLYYGRVVVRSLMDLATGRAGINELSGPVGIINAIGQAASYGWRDLLSMMALLTVNLGVFNLLPLPALDGGRIALLLLEGVRGKPLPPKVEERITLVGMSLLLALMFYVTTQDVGRILFG